MNGEKCEMNDKRTKKHTKSGVILRMSYEIDDDRDVNE